MLHLNRRHGSSKLVGVSAVLVFFCLVYLYLSEAPLACEGSLRPFLEGGNTTRQSKIGKVTVAANTLNGGTIYRALKTHEVHNEKHGYHHFLAKNQVVSSLIEHDFRHRPKGAWSKPAFLLSVLVAELEKDEEDRLEWVFWFDADTVILNPHTPLETFTPPRSRRDLDDVHLLISGNWDGLNSGAFALRVHPWSVSFMSAVLAYPIYETARQKKDRFRDQSAFQFLLQNIESPLAITPMNGKEHWAEVPMRWFNAMPFNNAFGKGGRWIYSGNMTAAKFDNGTTEVYADGNPTPAVVRAWKVMQGDLAVHFAGATAGAKGVRDSWMEPWLDRTEQWLPEWANETRQVELREEADRFWAKTARAMATARKKLRLDDTPARVDNSKKPLGKDSKDKKPMENKADKEQPADRKTTAPDDKKADAIKKPDETRKSNEQGKSTNSDKDNTQQGKDTKPDTGKVAVISKEKQQEVAKAAHKAELEDYIPPWKAVVPKRPQGKNPGRQ